MEDVLFTPQWWLLEALAIIPLIAWLIIVDKSRLVEMTAVWLFAATIASFLDVLGSPLLFWTYDFQLVQVVPILNPVDFVLLPCIYSFIYQWAPRWKSYIITLVFLAALGSFIAEPVFSWLKIYHLNTWKYIYSFPIYIAIGLGIKALMGKMKSIQDK